MIYNDDNSRGKTHDGHSKIYEKTMRRKQQQQQHMIAEQNQV